MLVPIQFDLAIAHAEVDGLEMGVLGDGTPYLTGRALARACGQPESLIRELDQHHAAGCSELRCRKIAGLLAAYSGSERVMGRDVTIAGQTERVYSDGASMAVLEYFAFDARSRASRIARRSFRRLAGQSLRQFIYGRVGYGGDSYAADSWQYLHDRIALNPMPLGYFGVFREITDFLISAIQSGLSLDSASIPDISVGLGWGRYWTQHSLDCVYGLRVRHPHHFPAGGAKAAAVDSWIYPIAGLDEFRAWMREDYLPKRLPVYLRRKAEQGVLAPARIDGLLAAMSAENSNVRVD
ncbi:MAG: hypothetical protein AAGC55_30880 [Myxococcota bacterium]